MCLVSSMLQWNEHPHVLGLQQQRSVSHIVWCESGTFLIGLSAGSGPGTQASSILLLHHLASFASDCAHRWHREGPKRKHPILNSYEPSPKDAQLLALQGGLPVSATDRKSIVASSLEEYVPIRELTYLLWQLGAFWAPGWVPQGEWIWPQGQSAPDVKLSYPFNHSPLGSHFP